MEDQQEKPSTTPPPAARTAQALRELHDRARTALAAQRERMVQLESQLTRQLDAIADTLAEQIASHGGPAHHTEQSLEEVSLLRAELEKTRLEWTTERDTWQAERAELVAADGDRSLALDTRQQELETRQQTLDERAADLNHQDRELRQRQESLESQMAASAAQQAQLMETQSAFAQQRSELVDREAVLQKWQADFDQAKSEHDQQQQKYLNDQSCLTAERDALQSERESVQTERARIEADRAALVAAHAALDAEREAVVGRLNTLSEASQLNADESATKLANLEQQLNTERTAWDRERAGVEEQRRLLAKERDDLSTALEAARGELTTAREQAAAAAERDELRLECDIALEDIQALRSRVAELEQELAGLPVADDASSVELVHLRAERDALAEQVAELKQRPRGSDDSAAAQDRDDLQRRVEMAMDDVRELKRKNGELEAQLVASKSQGVPTASVGGSSWEAMKKKMLANLEGEGDDVDEDRRRERDSIEDTIRITDDALSIKDREIAELKSHLAQRVHAVPDRNAAIEQLVDADEVIAEHRSRIAQLETEIQGKLRAAELELSVERAKIARDTAHLEELKAEMDSQRANGVTHAGPGVAQQPKRRWLSKLGLGADEEG